MRVYDNTVGRVNTASNDKLSVIQQEILIGTLLGDGRLESRSKNGSARLRIHHAESQKDYLFWKYGIFRNLVVRKPWQVTWQSKQTGNSYVAWFFHTKTLYELRSFHQLFYPTGKKIISLEMEKFLTPRALATWFMDDGCLSNKTIILNTQCFSIEQQHMLQQLLWKCVGVETTLNKDRLTYRLRMNQQNAEQFQSIIEPHVHRSMQYKLTPRND